MSATCQSLPLSDVHATTSPAVRPTATNPPAEIASSAQMVASSSGTPTDVHVIPSRDVQIEFVDAPASSASNGAENPAATNVPAPHAREVTLTTCSVVDDSGVCTQLVVGVHRHVV